VITPGGIDFKVTHHILETPVTEAQVRALKSATPSPWKKPCSASVTPT
jgi:hypothetical protein